MPNETQAYDATTIALHWFTAVAVTLLWTLGQTADLFPEGLVNHMLWSVHVVVGFMLAAVLCARIVWRGARGRRLPAADAGLLHAVTKSTHYLLYVLLVSTVLLGLINAFVRGYDLFGAVHLPQLGERVWRKPITDWHGLAADALLAIALAHAGAALLHHFVWRDSVLQRMLPVASRKKRIGVRKT